MSKLDQIQDELKRINQAKFQKLCDAYLHKLGYEKINPKGSVIGYEKTAKGTPDSWILLPNGNYGFVEYTTQQRDLFNKLSDDIDKCFDENKTGIPISKIEKVFLCYNATLEIAERDKLAEKCLQQNCDLED